MKSTLDCHSIMHEHVHGRSSQALDLAHPARTASSTIVGNAYTILGGIYYDVSTRVQNKDMQSLNN